MGDNNIWKSLSFCHFLWLDARLSPATHKRTKVENKHRYKLPPPQNAFLAPSVPVCVWAPMLAMAHGPCWGAWFEKRARGPLLTKPTISCCLAILCALSGKNQLCRRTTDHFNIWLLINFLRDPADAWGNEGRGGREGRAGQGSVFACWWSGKWKAGICWNMRVLWMREAVPLRGQVLSFCLRQLEKVLAVYTEPKKSVIYDKEISKHLMQ